MSLRAPGGLRAAGEAEMTRPDLDEEKEPSAASERMSTRSIDSVVGGAQPGRSRGVALSRVRKQLSVEAANLAPPSNPRLRLTVPVESPSPSPRNSGTRSAPGSPTTPTDTQEKALELSDAIKVARCAVVVTGPEISAAAHVQDYYSAGGFFTHWRSGHRPEIGSRIEDALPTYTHMALAALLRQGYFKHVVTTALDGLHLRAGVAPACLSELQGTIYKEMCSLCGRVYLRAYNAAAFTTSDDQFTGRVCENAQCLGRLTHYVRDAKQLSEEEFKQTKDFQTASEHLAKADLVVVVGAPLKHAPVLGLVQAVARRLGEVIVCDEQPNAYGDLCSLHVAGRPDAVFRSVMQSLHIEVRGWESEMFSIDNLALSSMELPAESEQSPRGSCLPCCARGGVE